MTMQCRDVREVLDSYLSQELLVETNHSVLRHLEGCPECRAELNARAGLRAALRRAVLNAPDLQMRPAFAGEVAARLQAVPAASRPALAGTPWTRRWLPMAASLLLAAGVGAYFILGGGHVPQIARDAVGDHQNCALKFRLSEKPVSLTEGAQRFDPFFARLENIPPNELRTDSGLFEVADRHVCLFAGRRFGHVVLKSGDHVVSLLVTANDPGSPAPTGSDVTRLPDVEGLSVASFAVPGHAAFVVSDLHDTPFQQVVRALEPPMRGLLTRLRNIFTTSGD